MCDIEVYDFEFREGFYWRVYKFEEGKVEVVPMTFWDEFDYEQGRFITLKLFDTNEEAEAFLNGF